MNIKQLKHNIKFVYVIQDKFNGFYLSYTCLSKIDSAIYFISRKAANEYIANTFFKFKQRYRILRIEK